MNKTNNNPICFDNNLLEISKKISELSLNLFDNMEKYDKLFKKNCDDEKKPDDKYENLYAKLLIEFNNCNKEHENYKKTCSELIIELNKCRKEYEECKKNCLITMIERNKYKNDNDECEKKKSECEIELEKCKKRYEHIYNIYISLKDECKDYENNKKELEKCKKECDECKKIRFELEFELKKCRESYAHLNNIYILLKDECRDYENIKRELEKYKMECEYIRNAYISLQINCHNKPNPPNPIPSKCNPNSICNNDRPILNDLDIKKLPDTYPTSHILSVSDKINDEEIKKMFDQMKEFEKKLNEKFGL